MHLLKFFLSLLLLLTSSFIFSQHYSDSAAYFEINQDPKISELIEKHIKINEHWGNIIGYRVQIFFDSGNNSKRMATETRAQFLARYPDIDAYIIFEDPHFKVRVGDFRTKMEAEGFRVKILSEYPGAFVTRDEINFPKLD